VLADARLLLPWGEAAKTGTDPFFASVDGPEVVPLHVPVEKITGAAERDIDAVTYAADPRNPYVYAQTVPDSVRMAARIRALSALHREGAAMQVSVIAPPSEQWPLPWYLRAMPNVGYWTTPDDPLALKAPVIVSSLEHAAAIERALGDRYVPEFFGLRPDVLIALYIDRGLWDRFLATTASPSASAR
jgi:hypothetical protein